MIDIQEIEAKVLECQILEFGMVLYVVCLMTHLRSPFCISILQIRLYNYNIYFHGNWQKYEIATAAALSHLLLYIFSIFHTLSLVVCID